MFLIIAITVGALVGIIWTWIEDGFSALIFIAGFAGAIGGFLIGMLAALFTMAPDYPDQTMEISTTKEYAIVSLEDNMGIQGSCYAFRATINSELKYVFLYEIKDRGITSFTIPADHTYITYTKDGEAPMVIEQKYTFKNPLRRFFSCDDYCMEYRLIVPEGTIAENSYNINLS